MAIRTIREKGATLWFDDQLLQAAEPRLFDLAWLQAEGHLSGSSAGRNQAWFLCYRGLDLVWRHFWRGGLIGRINPDLYLRLPAEQSRAVLEFRLLDWMRGEGLPVPRPVLARYQPAGLFYRADLITERIPAARTLAEILAGGAIAPQLWAEIGAVIAQMHGKGVHHSDLNCRNILLDAADKVWLIDFDKCERRPAGPWAAENLARLHRSLLKEQGKVPGLHWGEADWQALKLGYTAALRSERSCPK
ncbi:3-deoxy-D-manno-octulosonic acid kinase [Pseudogemmobacter faecipullorum]|uniref:3-deoxy-D-manno-octulosonic acid kinase n=1 Tax=Pseudogemmobacter faecipullorum TaxID=2755041 RepID=A0ABS8CSD3_9RHOB|nr:3-deoxy-D-manno-octulosonic acid kinase [Pseudogemmobacter faecipullorum]